MFIKNAFFTAWALALCHLTGLVLLPIIQRRRTVDRYEGRVESSLKWQTGTITLKDGLAKINLTDDFRFLDSADARKVLHNLWTIRTIPKSSA